MKSKYFVFLALSVISFNSHSFLSFFTHERINYKSYSINRDDMAKKIESALYTETKEDHIGKYTDRKNSL